MQMYTVSILLTLIKDILLPRRPSVTSIAVHPAGHFFAVGHADGTIAFWAVEDANQPLLVRTLDELDVDKVDGEALEAHLNKATTHGPSPREPIFKLAWSGFPNSPDPRGGETALTILGGFTPENGFGLTVLWFPTFNPEDPPPIQDGLHPSIATAIRQSLDEPRCFIYSTNAPVQDFYLVPRDSPHFNYTYDPYAILILVDAGQGARMVDSREFPPPCFARPQVQPAPPGTSQTEEDTLDALNAALESLSMAAYPQPVGMPFELNGSNFTADNYKIHVISREMYPELAQNLNSFGKRPRIRLSGGSSYMESSHETKVSKVTVSRVFRSSVSSSGFPTTVPAAPCSYRFQPKLDGQLLRH